MIVSAAAAPLTVPVKRDAVVWMQIGGCGDPPAEGCVPVPRRRRRTPTLVATDADTPSSPSSSRSTARGAVGEGVATVMGTRRGRRRAPCSARRASADGRTGVARRRESRRGRRDGRASRSCAAASRNARGHAGHRDRARAAQSTFDLTHALRRHGDGAVVVDATGPVVDRRARSTASGDISRSAPWSIADGATMTRARILLAVALVVVAALVAWVLERRRRPARADAGARHGSAAARPARLPAARTRRGSSCCGRRARASRVAACSRR